MGSHSGLSEPGPPLKSGWAGPGTIAGSWGRRETPLDEADLGAAAHALYERSDLRRVLAEGNQLGGQNGLANTSLKFMIDDIIEQWENDGRPGGHKALGATLRQMLEETRVDLLPP